MRPWMALLGVALLGLVACSSPSAPPVPPPVVPPWGAQSGDAPATPGGAVEPSTRAVPIQAVYLTTPSTGWVLTGAGLLRTTDAGRTWLPAGPPGYVGTSQTRAEFLSDRVGWLWEPDGFVWRTTDAGRTWEFTVLENVELRNITFVNLRRGWAMSHDNAFTGGAEVVRLLRTEDGGATWSMVSKVGYPGSPGEFPLGGIKSGVGFRDASVGWATGHYTNTEGLFLYRTFDGGATWKQVELTVPATMRASTNRMNQLWTKPPHFFGGKYGVLPLDGFCGDEVLCRAFYRTSDAGQTWQLGEPIRYSFGSVVVHDFADVSHGWASNGKAVYATADGGATWTKVSDLAGVVQLDFFGEQTGWALVDDALYGTTDGGKTWSLIAVDD